VKNSKNVNLIPADFIEATDFEINKLHRTYGLKVFVGLLDALNKTKREDAKFALLVQEEDAYVEVSYFVNEEDAEYARRKFRKITRLAFRDELKLSIAPLKEIELSK
jgi:hypothetical protein